MGLKKNYSQESILGKRILHNLKKNKNQDHTELLDQAAKDFDFTTCQNEYWNPEENSLLYGTEFWDQCSPSEKIILNQMYWVAYYSQIISAEIATILFNQTSAAGLYGLKDFRTVCDMLDMESSQERAHINAFHRISTQVEETLFGERLFSYDMKPYFHKTMIYTNTNRIKKFWKKLQLQYYTLLSSSNAFIACQYFTVRGLRTLNGKIIQHELSQYYMDHPDKESASIPSKVSYYHFMDESYHFNSSNLIGSEIIELLEEPTPFESFVANLGIKGTLKDHSNVNVTVRGIFWYEPALFSTIFKLMTSSAFKLDAREALNMMEKCFCTENLGVQKAFEVHSVTRESYKNYLSGLNYVSKNNKQLDPMSELNLSHYLSKNQKRLKRFKNETLHH